MDLLIVDDEPIIRKGLLKMAESYTPAFSKICTAANGLEALDIIQASEPDLIITDIRMPKMDGLELCRTLHEDFPHIPIVVISGYSDFEYAQKCMNYGIRHYLLKPVTKPDVHEVLNTMIKSQMKSFVPITRFVDWIDRMEQCIWSLQTDELVKLMEQWRLYCLTAHFTLPQLKELLEDCMSMLHKRFQERSYTPELSPRETVPHTAKEALDVFEAKLQRMADGLLASRNGNFKDPMEEAKAYINGRLAEEVTLEQVAQMVGLTPTYFSALFKKMTGETFVQYRIQQRMERAKELLAVPHIRIVDVATGVGYDDYPHFTKTFKKIVGVSPSEFRTRLGIK